MLRTLPLAFAGLALACAPALARGHGGYHHSSYHSSGYHSSYHHSGMHEHFATVVHQNRNGHIVTIRPRHARALHFYTRH